LSVREALLGSNTTRDQVDDQFKTMNQRNEIDVRSEANPEHFHSKQAITDNMIL